MKICVHRTAWRLRSPSGYQGPVCCKTVLTHHEVTSASNSRKLQGGVGKPNASNTTTLSVNKCCCRSLHSLQQAAYTTPLQSPPNKPVALNSISFARSPTAHVSKLTAAGTHDIRRKSSKEKAPSVCSAAPAITSRHPAQNKYKTVSTHNHSSFTWLMEKLRCNHAAARPRPHNPTQATHSTWRPCYNWLLPSCCLSLTCRPSSSPSPSLPSGARSPLPRGWACPAAPYTRRCCR